MLLKNITTLLILALIFLSCSKPPVSKFKNFVTVKDDKLMEGNQELRFVSFNIPTLHYIEDSLHFESTNIWGLPNEYEIRDGIKSIKQMGGKVVRIYVLSVKKEGDGEDVIRHVEGPDKFNEDAFRALDKVFEIANEEGIRIILPLIDNWKWWGGPKEYATFRGKETNEFWTDSLLIADFKKTIEFIVNRENYYTGVQYKDDKALLCWETGNELDNPYSWVKEIAAYIKSIDPNHLLADGFRQKVVRQEAIDDQNIDVLTTHHYEATENVVKNIKQSLNLIQNKKPFFIGEIGFHPVEEISAVIDTSISQNVSGVLIWSLRNRNRNGGFYSHYEKENYRAYHYPGFKSADKFEEKCMIDLVISKAAEINGIQIIMPPIPEPPLLLSAEENCLLTWQGSTGAESYIIERKITGTEEWEVSRENVTDGDYFYTATYWDNPKKIGDKYHYRIKALNKSGVSEPSNEIGPVEIKSRILIDNLDDFSLSVGVDTLSKITNSQSRKAREDYSRVLMQGESTLYYYAAANIKKVRVYTYFKGEITTPSFFFGKENVGLVEHKFHETIFNNQDNEYGYFTPVKYSIELNETGNNYFRIKTNSEVQIGRIEIEYQY